MSWPQTGHGPRFARGIRTSLSFASSSPTVAPRRLGLLLLRGDLAHVGLLALLELGQLLVAALVLLGGRLLLLGHLAVDAAPARHEQDLAARAEDVRLHRRLDAGVLELRLG